MQTSRLVLSKSVKTVHICPHSAECLTGAAATLLLANPVGQNGLDFSGLLSEASKVFGLRGRRLKLYLDQDLSQGKMSVEEYQYVFADICDAIYHLCVPELPADSSARTLDSKTLFVRVLPTTADA